MPQALVAKMPIMLAIRCESGGCGLDMTASETTNDTAYTNAEAADRALPITMCSVVAVTPVSKAFKLQHNQL